MAACVGNGAFGTGGKACRWASPRAVSRWDNAPATLVASGPGDVLAGAPGETAPHADGRGLIAALISSRRLVRAASPEQVNATQVNPKVKVTNLVLPNISCGSAIRISRWLLFTVINLMSTQLSPEYNHNF